MFFNLSDVSGRFVTMKKTIKGIFIEQVHLGWENGLTQGNDNRARWHRVNAHIILPGVDDIFNVVFYTIEVGMCKDTIEDRILYRNCLTA